MKTKEAQSIVVGDILGDGFVIDSVYMAIGSAPRTYFATGRAYGFIPNKAKYLGPFGHKLSVREL